MKTHIIGPSDRPLCGNDSFTAVINSSDCQTCNGRLARVLDLSWLVAQGEAEHHALAVELQKLGYGEGKGS